MGGTVADQVRRCLENLAAVCHAVGATYTTRSGSTVYTTEMAAFAQINEVYESFFESDPAGEGRDRAAAPATRREGSIDAVVAIPD